MTLMKNSYFFLRSFAAIILSIEKLKIKCDSLFGEYQVGDSGPQVRSVGKFLN